MSCSYLTNTVSCVFHFHLALIFAKALPDSGVLGYLILVCFHQVNDYAIQFKLEIGPSVILKQHTFIVVTNYYFSRARQVATRLATNKIIL